MFLQELIVASRIDRLITLRVNQIFTKFAIRDDSCYFFYFHCHLYRSWTKILTTVAQNLLYIVLDNIIRFHNVVSGYASKYSSLTASGSWVHKITSVVYRTRFPVTHLAWVGYTTQFAVTHGYESRLHNPVRGYSWLLKPVNQPGFRLRMVKSVGYKPGS